MNVLREGREEAVPLETVAVGDVFRVRPGERVALDGVIQAGSSALDESLLTGESMPVERGPGEVVVGGALNQHGVVEVAATAVGEDTVLRRMAALVVEAQGSRARVERVVDAVAAVFVPVVLVLALGTFLGWGLLGRLVRGCDGERGRRARHRLSLRPRPGDADGDHRGHGHGRGAGHPHPQRGGAGDGSGH